jgi:AcrR family transcriptional regulator
VPKLWSQTIETHRAAVRDAILDTTMALVAEHGRAAVTMSRIAEEAGIGRATLYKYFPDVEAILVAWHQRQVTDHLRQLAELLDHVGDPRRRLQTVLEAYALLRYQAHGSELAALLHRSPHVAEAQQQLSGFLQELLADGAAGGEVRDDIPPGELASYCLHALTAASSLPSNAAVRRLVTVTLAGLRPPHATVEDWTVERR